MPVMILNATRYYDPFIDSEAVRVSVTVEGRGEYWVGMPLAVKAKQRRREREEAEEAISDAIARGDEPGEVMTTARRAV